MWDGKHETQTQGNEMNATTQRVIEECQTQLAINFDIPARDIVSYYGSKIGLSYDEMRELLRSLCRSE